MVALKETSKGFSDQKDTEQPPVARDSREGIWVQYQAESFRLVLTKNPSQVKDADGIPANPQGNYLGV